MIFFSAIFLVYLSITCGWMVGKRVAAVPDQKSSYHRYFASLAPPRIF